MGITKFITKYEQKKSSLIHLQYDLDLPSANDARVLVCYYAVRDAVRGACGPRLSTAPPFVVSGWLWSCRVWNAAEVGACLEGSREGILYDEIYITILN